MNWSTILLMIGLSIIVGVVVTFVSRSRLSTSGTDLAVPFVGGTLITFAILVFYKVGYDIIQKLLGK